MAGAQSQVTQNQGNDDRAFWSSLARTQHILQLSEARLAEIKRRISEGRIILPQYRQHWKGKGKE
jgi:hypothetical protein